MLCKLLSTVQIFNLREHLRKLDFSLDKMIIPLQLSVCYYSALMNIFPLKNSFLQTSFFWLYSSYKECRWRQATSVIKFSHVSTFFVSIGTSFGLVVDTPLANVVNKPLSSVVDKPLTNVVDKPLPSVVDAWRGNTVVSMLEDDWTPVKMNVIFVG